MSTQNKPLSKAAQKRLERQEAIDSLKKLLKPGDTVYTVLRKVSSSGMSRQISLYIVKDGDMVDISFDAAKALEWPLTEGYSWRAVRVGGCGMDMGFHLVYSLSSVLFRDDFSCIGEGDTSKHWTKTRCPSNDHSNGDRNFEPHKHSDGGYALRQVWK